MHSIYIYICDMSVLAWLRVINKQPVTSHFIGFINNVTKQGLGRTTILEWSVRALHVVSVAAMMIFFLEILLN